MKINKLITKVNRYIGRSGNTIKWIVIHYVGADGGAKENCQFFENVNRNASAHYFVGHNGDIWQCVNDKDTAWHCGGGLQGTKGHKYYGQCINSNSIGIELCVKRKDGKWVYAKETLNAAAELVQEKMAEYGIDADHVIRHFDVTGKECPANYLTNETWNKLHSKLTSRTAHESKPTTDQISVDGYWGIKTTKKAQKVFKTTVDGIVSNQYAMYKAKNPGLQPDTWQWLSKPSKAGSQLIKAIQRKVGASVNGYIGPETISKMQKWLGTTQDGVVSSPSQLVKTFQRWLNEQ